MPLYDHRGNVLPPSQHAKSAPPKAVGDAFGPWAGRDIIYNSLPGGGVVQFDLSRLTLSDYRSMRDHYQVNANLSVLSFMMHQIDWHVVSDNKTQAEFLDTNLREVWTRLIRAVSQSYWAGYSPTAVEYENDVGSGRIKLNKFKDLIPEECRVNWKLIDGYKPLGANVSPKIKIFDGIKQFGNAYPIPVDNSFWYPLLMENGDYYGKKLLRPAFTSWFFSILMHLFSNRYFERFGEPVPIGRADFDSELDYNGTTMAGNKAMEQILTQLRNRSVVVLPSDRQQIGTSGRSEYLYDIQYLESQMRGADFDRYIDRLDEEISLSLFTPVLLLRTADVGSYNLGVGHMQMYMYMLNALAGDLKEYMDKFILRPLKNFNYGENAPEATWEFRKMGKQDTETVRAIVTAMFQDGTAKPDYDELSDAVGLSLTEVKVLAQDPTVPDPNAPDPAKPAPKKKPTGQPKATAKAISSRMAEQVEKAFRQGTFGSDFNPDMGYRRRFEESLRAEGWPDAFKDAETFYGKMEHWISDLLSLRAEEYGSPESFMAMFDRGVEVMIDELSTS